MFASMRRGATLGWLVCAASLFACAPQQPAPASAAPPRPTVSAEPLDADVDGHAAAPVSPAPEAAIDAVVEEKPIKLGRLRVREVPAARDALGDPKKLSALFSAHEGDTVELATIRNSMKAVETRYDAGGYPSAHVVMTTEADPQTGATNVEVTIERDIQYRVTRIDVRGATATTKATMAQIRAAFGMKVGDLYRGVAVAEGQARVRALGFREVGVATDAPDVHEPARVIVIVEVSE
jgi:outer membrane protein assembly factor BamA